MYRDELTRGSVSVLLLLCLLPMVTFAGLMTDAARISAAKTEILSAQELCGNTILSDYDIYLQESYGIFGVNTDTKEMKNTVFSAFDGTICAKGRYDNINDLKTQSFSVFPVEGTQLSDPGMLGQQISTYMKFRAPEGLAETILIKAAAFSGADKLKKVTEAKNKYDKTVAKYSGKLLSIKDAVDRYNSSKTADNAASAAQKIRTYLGETDDEKQAGKDLDELISSLSSGPLKNTFSADRRASSDVFDKSSADKIIETMENGGEIDDANDFYRSLKKSSADDGSSDRDLQSKLETFSSSSSGTAKTVEDGLTVSSMIPYEIIQRFGTTDDRDEKTFSAADLGKDLKNGLYYEEYLYSKFDCRTKNGFPEQEYIIFGKDELAADEAAAADMIFAVRYALNCAFAFSDPALRASAMSAAAAVAGWSGLGAIALRNIILAAWAAAETAVDMHQLLSGKSVPVWKSADTWNLSINGLAKDLAGTAADIVCKGIDDIFEQIYAVPDGAVEKLEQTANGYIDRTGKELSKAAVSYAQDLMNEAFSSLPASSVISGMTSQDLSGTMKDLLNTQITKAEKTEGITGAAAVYLLRYIRDNECEKTADKFFSETFDMSSGQSVSQRLSELIDTEMQSLTGELEKMAVQKTAEYSDAAKQQIRDVISKGGDKIKTSATAVIEKYLGNAGMGSASGSGVSGASAVTMTYEEYLRVFMLAELSSGAKDRMLIRAAKLMQADIMKTEPDFDITRTYTSVTVKVSCGVRTTFMFNDGFRLKNRRKILKSTYTCGYGRNSDETDT